MNKILWMSLVLRVLFLVFLPVLSESALYQMQLDKKNQIQDTQKAVEYFEKELEFTTNPYSVKVA